MLVVCVDTEPGEGLHPLVCVFTDHTFENNFYTKVYVVVCEDTHYGEKCMVVVCEDIDHGEDTSKVEK